MRKKIWLEYLENTRPYQWWRANMNRDLVRFLARYVLADQSNLRLAEVACGSGFAAHLLAQYPEVDLSIAADLNLEDYKQAAIPNFSGSFLRADLFWPPLQSASLDLVWNSSSIEELNHPEEAVRSMASLVKPGGHVFVGVPSRHGIAGWLRHLPSARTRAWLGRVYDQTELMRLMKGAGLQPEQTISYLFGTFIGLLARKRLQ